MCVCVPVAVGNITLIIMASILNPTEAVLRQLLPYHWEFSPCGLCPEFLRFKNHWYWYSSACIYILLTSELVRINTYGMYMSLSKWFMTKHYKRGTLWSLCILPKVKYNSTVTLWQIENQDFSSKIGKLGQPGDALGFGNTLGILW